MRYLNEHPECAVEAVELLVWDSEKHEVCRLKAGQDWAAYHGAEIVGRVFPAD
ncbi:MAG: hypothetical protein KFB93_08815 [Simkaniaceae bacterium]|nr:MAG: hypothetical protein KFB93_08815 [Simkaniaceae bacterium]